MNVNYSNLTKADHEVAVRQLSEQVDWATRHEHFALAKYLEVALAHASYAVEHFHDFD
jgi:hypothetical protein